MDMMRDTLTAEREPLVHQFIRGRLGSLTPREQTAERVHAASLRR